MRTPTLVLLLAAPVLGQVDAARAFLPADYHGEMFADLAALRELGIWDVIERSAPYRLARSKLREELGLDLELIDSFRRVIADLGADDGGERSGAIVLRGAEDLALPSVGTAGKLRDRDVVRIDAGSGADVWLAPSPGVLVLTSEPAAERALGSEAGGGVPHPELLALVASRRPLAHVAAARAGIDRDRWLRRAGFPHDWLTDADSVEGFALQIAETEGHRVAVTLLIRFERGDRGPERFEEGLRAGMASLAKEMLAPIIGELCDAVRFEREGADLRARLDLGTPRQAGDKLTQLMLPLMGALFVGGTQAAPQLAPQVVPAAAPAPAPQRGVEGPGKR